MEKRKLLLASLAAGAGHKHTPVQIQKLLFILEQNVSADLGGSTFDFKPYDYGPFDATVYEELRSLETDGLAVSSATQRGWKKYELTHEGVVLGESVLTTLAPGTSTYIRKVSEFVRSLSFTDLVSAVYKAYPEMKANSVFRGP
jgi:uncharacterized protein